MATGLPVDRGVPFAIDVTMVSVLHSDGRPWAEADVVAGICLDRGKQTKETTYPELVDATDVHLTTMACEVGGCWSTACADLLAQLAAARARAAPRASPSTGSTAGIRGSMAQPPLLCATGCSGCQLGRRRRPDAGARRFS